MNDGSTEEESEYTLVVTVANPAHVEQLMRTATDVATANEGRVRAVTITHSPPTSPFALFSDAT